MNFERRLELIYKLSKDEETQLKEEYDLDIWIEIYVSKVPAGYSVLVEYFDWQGKKSSKKKNTNKTTYCNFLICGHPSGEVSTTPIYDNDRHNHPYWLINHFEGLEFEESGLIHKIRDILSDEYIDIEEEINGYAECDE